MSPAPQAVLTRRSEIESRPVDSGAVLVNLRSGEAFELNRIGAEIWHLLGDGTTEAAITDALAAKYKVDRPTIDSDVRKLLSSLASAGLIQTDDLHIGQHGR